MASVGETDESYLEDVPVIQWILSLGHFTIYQKGYKLAEFLQAWEVSLPLILTASLLLK